MTTLQIFKGELDNLMKLVGNKQFTFPDVKVTISGNKLIASGACAEHIFGFRLEQRLERAVEEDIEICFAVSELQNMLTIFKNVLDIQMSILGNDTCQFASKDGKYVMNLKKTFHTTEIPDQLFELDTDGARFNIAVSELKSVLAGFGIGSTDMVLKTSCGKLETFFENASKSSVKLSSKIKDIDMKEISVKLDKLIVDAIAPFDALSTMDVCISSSRPTFLKQTTETAVVEVMFVPFDL